MRKIAGCACTGMPGTFSPTPASKETASQLSRHASRHVRHARVVMHVGIAIPWLWVKRSRHSRRMRNSQFYVSGPLWWHHITHQIIGNTIVCSTAYNHSYTLLSVRGLTSQRANGEERVSISWRHRTWLSQLSFQWHLLDQAAEQTRRNSFTYLSMNCYPKGEQGWYYRQPFWMT